MIARSARMHTQLKASLVLSGAIIVGITRLGSGQALCISFAGMLTLGWLILFGVLMLSVRCPHCRKCVFLTRSGGEIFMIGRNCQHCGKRFNRGTLII
jgi:hypothetical protein